jgi:hypothetical protein
LTVAIIAVNGIPAQTLNESGYMRISAGDLESNMQERELAIAAEREQQEMEIAEKKRLREANAPQRWYHAGVSFDMYFVNVFDQSDEMEHDFSETTSIGTDGKENTSSNSAKRRLYGGKFGIDFGFGHFSIGAYFAFAGYKAGYIIKDAVPPDSGTVSHFGFGGDFPAMFSINIETGGTTPFKLAIGPGLTMLFFPEDELNVPNLFPYLQFFMHYMLLDMGIRVVLPAVNGKVKPAIVLDMGFGAIWNAKKR